MHSKLEIVDPTNYAGWDELLSSNQDSMLFHTSAWARVLAESYRYNAVYFASFDHDKLLAAIPVMEVKSILTGRRGVSLPFSDYCEPIIDEKSCRPEVMASIIQYAKNAGWKSLELRGETILQQDIAPSSYFYGHTLDLSQNEKQIFSSFRTSTKGNIRKAIKEGVKVNFYNTLEAVKEFYQLNCVTRKRHGLPPQPYHFFRKVFERIISENLGFVALAAYMKKIIGGAVYFHFGQKAMYKYAASDHSHKHLMASYLLIWEAIKWYSQNGYRSLCFGRTDADNEGLRHFKRGWGTEERMIKYFKYDLKKDAFASDHHIVKPWHNKVFNKMPIRLLKIIGALAYKHLG